MGIADYGVGPNGDYEYFTNSSLGSADIVSLSVANSTGGTWVGFQLNVNLQFSVNGKQYTYWDQDVARVQTSSRYIDFEDNIWNFSGTKAGMAGSALSGNGQVYKSGNLSYYAAGAGSPLAGNGVFLLYPLTLSFEINATVNHSNQPQLTFGYYDGYGWQVFDTVTFKTTGTLALRGFEVDGLSYTPYGNFYDSEMIIAGYCCGEQTSDASSDVRFQLSYWNGHNYQMVTNAYNFGSDTAEEIQNAQSQWYYYPANGALIAELQAGSGALGKLWDQSRIGIIDMQPGIPSGILYVKNASNPNAVAAQYPFIKGEVTVVVQPGTYDLSVYQSGALFSEGDYVLVAGQTLRLPSHPIIALTLSYSVSGGGSGYSPPTLAYTSNGQPITAILSTSPTTYSLDSRSTWSITGTLTGSSSIERWTTAQTASGIATSAQTINMIYYHQFYIVLGFGVVGGGSGYTVPTITGEQFGSPTATGAGSSVWLDAGSTFSYPTVLLGSTSTERWATTSASGTVSSAALISVTYHHQFFLSVTGGSTSSQWYDSSSTATVTATGVYDRSGGEGLRIVSYTVDGGAATPVSPTAGNVIISVVMNGPHSMIINSIQQYEITLDAGATQALDSITPPTIGGDNYWYDLGSSVNVVLNGIWGRSSGSGDRLVSISVNGTQPTPVSTAGTIIALTVSSMSSPQELVTTTTAQYQLSTPSGSVMSVTSPPISGDAGWYDSGSQVTVTYSYVWDIHVNQSRLNAVAFSVDNGLANALPRSGAGTFPAVETMGSSHKINVSSVVQFYLIYSGGFGKATSVKSPTGDGYFDAGTNMTVSTDYTWGVLRGNTRQNLLSYTLDGGTYNVTRAETGTFTTPTVTFNTYHNLAFNSIEQFLVSFGFTDNSGSSTITPTNLQIEVNNHVENLSGFSSWFDNGGRLGVVGVFWEGSDVRPNNLTAYQVSGPAQITIHARVYEAALRVADYLGVPVAGAQVAVSLANGTTVTRSTQSDGTVNMGLIPIGTYMATVTNFGIPTHISGDASVQATAQATVFASYPMFGLVAAIAIIAALVGLFMIRRRSGSGGHEAPKRRQQSSTATLAFCTQCGKQIESGATTCPLCGASQL